MNFSEIKTIADRALADGILTQAEINEIIAAINDDGEASPDEIALLNSIYRRIQRGEIKIESCRRTSPPTYYKPSNPPTSPPSVQ